MKVKSIIVIFCLTAGVNLSGIEDKVTQYFKSDIFKAFQKHWRAHRHSFENAIVSSLKESYGNRGMNIYVRRSENTLRISTGLYGSDNVIDWLFTDVTLNSLPTLNMPVVTFALASNVLHVVAGLSKMILVAKYGLFRNQSDVVYSTVEPIIQESPFSFVQVQPHGDVAIVAEDCTIDGYVLAKLSGMSINLGHDTFRVKNCKFSVEISSDQQPPIIAPYFTVKQTKQLQYLLTRPIRAEMMPKVQAAVFSFINTSLVFGDYLPKFREYQNEIFKETLKYVKDIAIAIDNKTVEANLATLDADPAKLVWKANCPENFCSADVVVANVTVHGLDTLYSSHSGGPCKLKSAKIMEALRFNSLMVRGSISFENDTVKGNHEFLTEIHDISVDFEVDVEKREAKFDVLGWRLFELSIVELEKHQRYRKSLNAFIYGYLENELSMLLNNHLTNIYRNLRNTVPLLVNNTNCHCSNERKGT